MLPAKEKVLIAENDAAVLTSLEQTLSIIGYVVRTVTEGLAAVAALRERAPEILPSDLSMPGLSGYELLAAVNRCFPGAWGVAMSGKVGDVHSPDASAAKADRKKLRRIPTLLKAIEDSQTTEGPGQSPQRVIRMQKINYEAGRLDSIVMACPNCFREFPQAISGAPGLLLDTNCIHCGASIVLAVVPALETIFAVPYRPTSPRGSN